MSYTKAALKGCGELDSYTDAALKGYGDLESYTNAALKGYGDLESYTNAALRGYGDLESYTNSALRGYGDLDMLAKELLKKKRRTSKKKTRSSGGHAIFLDGEEEKRKEFVDWLKRKFENGEISQRKLAASMPYRKTYVPDADAGEKSLPEKLKTRYNRIPNYVKKQLKEKATEYNQDTESGKNALVASLYRLHQYIYPKYDIVLRKRRTPAREREAEAALEDIGLSSPPTKRRKTTQTQRLQDASDDFLRGFNPSSSRRRRR